MFCDWSKFKGPMSQDSESTWDLYPIQVLSFVLELQSKLLQALFSFIVKKYCQMSDVMSKRLSQSAEKFPRVNVCVTNTEQADISIVMPFKAYYL